MSIKYARPSRTVSFYRRDLDDVYCYYYNQPIAITRGYEEVNCFKRAFLKLHPVIRFLLAVLFFLTIALVILVVAFLIVHLLVSNGYNTDWSLEGWRNG